MGFRFRKSIRLLPGLRLNLSKSGVSASIGEAGATINIGPKGARATVGLPGTGLSYSESLGQPGAGEAAPADPGAPRRRAGPALWLLIVVVLAVLAIVLLRP